MGILYTGQCTKCGYSHVFPLGSGFMVKNCESDALKAKAIISIVDNSGTEREFGAKCSSCGKELRIYGDDIDISSDEVECPICKQNKLIFDSIGIWD